MKKLFTAVLVSLSLLFAGGAFAQSNTVISGEARMFQTSTKVGELKSVSKMASDESHLGFKVVEDLGSGLKVNVNLDTFITANDASTGNLGSYQSTIGMSSKYGSFDVGRKKSTLNEIAGVADPLGTRFGSTFGRVHNLQTARLDNGIFLETGNFYGFKAAYNYGQSNESDVAGTDAVSVQYNGYGANVRYAGQFENATGGKTNLVGAGYTFTKYKTYIGYDYSMSYTSATSARTKGNSLAFAQPYGAFTTKVTYGRSKTDGVDESLVATSLGVSYNLSKRTAIETAYSKVDAPALAADTRTFGIGLAHAF